MDIEPLGLTANQWQFLEGDENADRYIKAAADTDRPLSDESTRRQFKAARDILVRLNGSHGEVARRGILLADDVGLGKTTVAALVAWVVASAGSKRGIRILAPNDVMARRWVEELRSHVPMLRKCAPRLGASESRIKVGRVGRLSAGSIQVVKHSYASSSASLNLACDLLIVDEAHRAKGEATSFSKNLRKKKNSFGRVLILTATPFSINLDEMHRMLRLISAEDAWAPVQAFGRALKNLYSGSTARSHEIVGERLASKAVAAVKEIATVVVRHSVDDLPREAGAFGCIGDWSIEVPSASPTEIELMIRVDRALRVAKDAGLESVKATNDARFHVGWRHFDSVCADLQRDVISLPEPIRALVGHQLSAIRKSRRTVGSHSKMVAVGEAVKLAVEHGEKVILFCHYHATAQELTKYLASVLPTPKPLPAPHLPAWKQAWEKLIAKPESNWRDEQLRNTFIEWLCADLIREQIWHWLRQTNTSPFNLVSALKKIKGRHPRASETIAGAAQRLFKALCESTSSRAVLLKACEEGRLDLLPGANGASRVLGVCEPTEDPLERFLFLHNRQPDTVISIFNSPFGPDVLVVTDKLSEGIDLHRYCRHLIHYELDPSPIRTVQRNGRLRRVNSWAAITQQPIMLAYPAFRGTRDHKLVQVMKKRIASFSLLLGGVQDFDVEVIEGSDEDWRNQVIAAAKTRLEKAGGQLQAKDY